MKPDDILLKSAERQMEQIFSIYQDRFEDLKTAYEVSITEIKDKRSKRAWSNFDLLKEIPVVGLFYKVIKSPPDNAMLKDHLHSLQNSFSRLHANHHVQFEHLTGIQSKSAKNHSSIKHPSVKGCQRTEM